MFLKGRSFQLQWTPESLNQAIDFYNQAIAFDNYYAKAYYANLQCKNAYIHIQKVLNINPNYIDGLKAMAEMCIALGFFDIALAYANTFLEVDPLSANNHYILAHIYYYQGQFEKALETVNYTLTHNPQIELAHHLKCFCLIWLKRGEEFEALIQNTSLQTEKRILFQLINDKAIKVPDEMIEKWSLSAEKETMLVPYDVFILSNSNHKDLPFSRLQSMVSQRRGQIISYRQEPFIQPLNGIKGFSKLHESNLVIADFKPSEDAEEKQSSSILDNNQLETLKAKLLSYFTDEEPFLNPQLSLKFVADILDLNTNKVSYLINKVFHLNFNDFVNSYRLEHFKSIALDPKNAHLTILGLAYDSGFNSKSEFNTYFKKIEGLTPRAWLKANSQ